MTVLVNLLIRSVIRKVATSDIKYDITLNAIVKVDASKVNRVHLTAH